ncbi:MAG: cytochrome c maturation protein CcmE [Bacillota bacterium]|nr:MAG: cytochrome c maturation protein CcmE [Bacillota bacterium]
MGRRIAVRSRLMLAGVLVLAAVVYLAYTSWQGAAMYYLTPSEVASQGEALRGRSFRLAGVVAEGSVVFDAAEGELRFDVVDDTSAVPVLYAGSLPDNFAAGQQVVAEGTGDGTGGMVATRLIIKCPSKYEEGSAQTASGRNTLLIGVAGVAGSAVLVGCVALLVGRGRRPRGRV